MGMHGCVCVLCVPTHATAKMAQQEGARQGKLRWAKQTMSPHCAMTCTVGSQARQSKIFITCKIIHSSCHKVHRVDLTILCLFLSVFLSVWTPWSRRLYMLGLLNLVPISLNIAGRKRLFYNSTTPTYATVNIEVMQELIWLDGSAISRAHSTVHFVSILPQHCTISAALRLILNKILTWLCSQWLCSWLIGNLPNVYPLSTPRHFITLSAPASIVIIVPSSSNFDAIHLKALKVLNFKWARQLKKKSWNENKKPQKQNHISRAKQTAHCHWVCP